MARRKSSVKLLDLLAEFNRAILLETTEEARKPLCLMIEHLLMDNGHYGGFGYCDQQGNMIGGLIADGTIKHDQIIEHLRQYYWKA